MPATNKPAASKPADQQNPNAPSAKPGAPGPDTAGAAAKPPKEKVVKTSWGERNAEGELVTRLKWEKGASLPSGYDIKKHNPLLPKDFEKRADFLQYRADRMLAAATQLQKDADDERAGVGKTMKIKQKKLLKLKEGYDALMAELKAAGVDISKLVPQG